MEKSVAIGRRTVDKDQQTDGHHNPGEKCRENKCICSHEMSHVLSEERSHHEFEPYKIDNNHTYKSDTKEFEPEKRGKCHDYEKK